MLLYGQIDDLPFDPTWVYVIGSASLIIAAVWLFLHRRAEYQAHRSLKSIEKSSDFQSIDPPEIVEKMVRYYYSHLMMSRYTRANTQVEQCLIGTTSKPTIYALIASVLPERRPGFAQDEWVGRSGHTGVSMLIADGVDPPLPPFRLRPNELLSRIVLANAKNALPKGHALAPANFVIAEDWKWVAALFREPAAVEVFRKNHLWQIDCIGSTLSLHIESHYAAARDFDRLLEDFLTILDALKNARTTMPKVYG